MQLENIFHSCFLLLKLVCVDSQRFSLLACPEDTFSDVPLSLAGAAAELKKFWSGKFWVKKKFGSKKIFGQKIFLVKEFFWS